MSGVTMSGVTMSAVVRTKGLLGSTARQAVDVVVACRPQVLDRVRAPRPPGRRAAGQGGRGGRAGRAARAAARTPRSVAGNASGSPSAAHGDGLDRPRADAGDGGEPRPRLMPVTADAQVDLAAGQRRRPARRTTPAAICGIASVVRPAAASAAGVGEQAGEPAAGIVDRLAVRRRQPACVRARRGGRDLLAEHRSQRELARRRPSAARGGRAPCRPAGRAPRRRRAGRRSPPGRRRGPAAGGTG